MLVPPMLTIVLGSLSEYTACTLHQPRLNIPLEKWYLAVVGHNAIRISPVVRRRRRLEGTTHGMLFTLNYSRHRGRNTHYPSPPPRRRCTCGSQPHHPRKPTDILDKRCPGTKISAVQHSIHRTGEKRQETTIGVRLNRKSCVSREQGDFHWIWQFNFKVDLLSESERMRRQIEGKMLAFFKSKRRLSNGIVIDLKLRGY